MDEINFELAYFPSEDIVAREIEGELIIIPLVSGIGDLEDEIFTLNETGKVIWKKLSPKYRLKQVITELSSEYEAPSDQIEKDVIGLLFELLKRKMVVAATPG